MRRTAGANLSFLNGYSEYQRVLFEMMMLAEAGVLARWVEKASFSKHATQRDSCMLEQATQYIRVVSSVKKFHYIGSDEQKASVLQRLGI